MAARAPKPSAEQEPWQWPMSPQQTQAFEVYYAMTPKRSMQKTASALKVTKRAIEMWSHKYHWGRRIEERNREYAEKAKRKTDQTLDQQREMLLNLWRGVLQKVVRKNEKGEAFITIAPENVNDLDKATRNILLLSGEATDRTEVVKYLIVNVFAVIDELVADQTLRTKIFQRLSVLEGTGALPGPDREGEGDAGVQGVHVEG